MQKPSHFGTAQIADKPHRFQVGFVIAEVLKGVSARLEDNKTYQGADEES